MGLTIKDVAERAGVSVTTVSRVLNNRGSLSEKTRKKVYAAMEELNYHPNQLAVNLFKRRTMLVGLIVPVISHVFYALETKYIEQYLYTHDYKMILCSASENHWREKENLIMLQRNKVDGIIIASHTLDLEDYNKISLPVVALDRYLGKNIPTISADHQQGGRLAAEEFLRCNCKKVAQVIGFSAVPTPSNERHIVFRRIMEENNIVCIDYELPLNTFKYTEYIDVVQEILANDPDIDGIFAVDNIANAACKVAAALQINVPEQLKIVGYDGTELSMMGNLSLSTVVQPIRKIAWSAVDNLLSMISGKSDDCHDVHIRLPVTFTRRDTT